MRSSSESPKKLSGVVQTIKSTSILSLTGDIYYDCPRIQRCCNPISILLCLCAIACTQSCLTGYVSSILSTIEVHFNLLSSHSGMIKGTYDFACTCSIIIIGYVVTEEHNRARCLGLGAMLMFLGALLFALPNLLMRYDPVKTDSTIGNSTGLGDVHDDKFLCNFTRSNITDEICSEKKLGINKLALAIFLIAQIVIGFGAGPIYTLGPIYLYDNVGQRSYSVYAGFFFSMAALGPALGFLEGAYFLSYYVNPWDTSINITKDDPAWVGSWWMGFLVCGFVCLFISIPLMMLPKQLPTRDRYSRRSSFEKINKPAVIRFSSIRDFFKKTASIFQNRTWFFITCASVMEQSILSGLVAFIAKYFQVTFGFTASHSNIITGSILIPAAFTGIICGGFIMKRYAFSVPNTCKLLCGLTIAPLIGVVGLMFFTCSGSRFAGVTDSYEIIHSQYVKNYPPINNTTPALLGDCNSGCQCTSEFMPVCGSNNYTYFSPCHAGCTHYANDTKNYTSCNCIKGPEYKDLGFIRTTSLCEYGCNAAPFLLLFFYIIFFTTCGQNPGLMILLRCVDTSKRLNSLGLQNVMARVFACIPAPLYVGKIFDSQCLVWSKACYKSGGGCLVYNTKLLSYLVFGLCFVLKSFALFFHVLTYWSCHNKIKPEKKSLTSSRSDNSNVTFSKTIIWHVSNDDEIAMAMGKPVQGVISGKGLGQVGSTHVITKGIIKRDIEK